MSREEGCIDCQGCEDYDECPCGCHMESRMVCGSCGKEYTLPWDKVTFGYCNNCTIIDAKPTEEPEDKK